MLTIMTKVMVQNVYEIDRVAFSSTSVLTNTTPTTAYRGAGRPEAIPRDRAGDRPLHGGDRYGPRRGPPTQLHPK